MYSGRPSFLPSLIKMWHSRGAEGTTLSLIRFFLFITLTLPLPISDWRSLHTRPLIDLTILNSIINIDSQIMQEAIEAVINMRYFI